MAEETAGKEEAKESPPAEAPKPAKASKKAKNGGLTAEDVFAWIDNLTVLELADFIKQFEERYDVKAVAPAAVVAVPGAGAAAAEAEEQTEFAAVLASIGEKKIQVIKTVRAVTGLGLKEAKDLVEGAPTPIKEGIPRAEAEEIKKQVEESGATVEIK